ncbi:hypothetical protein GQ651_15110 [Alphaproteobacteria bacterium GH1-50]|uniref:Uncharacterized protein n=1 Tax=Kangsaoukella pontilimi TaxID=2691042 RepID=A0A7C9MLE2_9RHOB|nr:hypothetical protein [Kangsaoukella pontilimi]MXQ09175.1 hypothetical protein [Kangsaoukella pontilimi]
MDPTHYLASPSRAPRSSGNRTEQAFYEDHATNPITTVARTAAALRTWFSRPTDGSPEARFAPGVPAE